MQTFFLEQMDFIYFFYGLSFLFLSFVSYLLHGINKKELSWKFLSLFALFRGLYQYLVLLQMIFGVQLWLTVTLFTFHLLSFVALFEFGRRGFNHDRKLLDTRVYFPIAVLLGLVWWLGGFENVTLAIRYAIGFPGAILAGLIFWRWSSQKMVRSIFIRPVAIAFWFYALSQLITEFNPFLKQFGIPVQLLWIVFSIVAFQGIWFQYQYFLSSEMSGQGVVKKQVFKTRIIFVTIFFLLLTTGIDYIFVNQLGNYARTEVVELSDKDTETILANLRHLILEADGMVSSLSLSPAIIKNFVEQAENGKDVDAVLDGCLNVIREGVCYLLNKEGVVTGSSNRNDPDSFFGKNYAFRSYFIDAIQGKTGKLFALGVTSKRPGYYVSSPVKNSLGENLGVAVVKMNLDSVEKVMTGYKTTFFASPEGVVFLTGNPDWVGKSLVGLTESVKQSILEKQLFGKGSFERMFHTWPNDGSIVQLDQEDYLVRSKQVTSDGWQLLVLSDIKTIQYYRLFGLITTFLFYFLLMLFVSISQIIRRNAVFSYFTSAVYSSQDAIIGKDLNGKIMTWNFGAEKIYGYKEDEIIGKSINILFSKEWQEKNTLLLSSLYKGKTIENFEMKHLNKSGDAIDVSVTISSIQDSDGSMIGVSMISRDISIVKKLEKSKMEFISIASHQLRTPLTGIKWFSELLLHNKTEVLSKTTREYVQQISDSNQRMINLVNDLLEVSHLDDKGKYQLEKSKQDFSALLKDVVEQQKILAHVNKIVIRLDSNCLKKILMNVDVMKMSQVLQNILNNAIKFSHPKGVISISCGKKNAQLLCSVKDHGMGIPSHQQSRIFEKFFRADNSVNAGSGTGLGLYIAKNIIEEHGGKIWFESEENKGTTIYFSLPVIKE